MYLYYRRSADPQRHGPTEEEMDAMREHWLTNLHEGLVALATAWRCQIGDDRFKRHCVEAQARRITHPDWPWIDHDMRMEQGHREWWLHMRGPQHGPRLPYGHAIKRQQTDDSLPPDLRSRPMPTEGKPVKKPWNHMTARQRRLAAKYWTVEWHYANDREDEERVKEVEEGARRDGCVWSDSGEFFQPGEFDPAKHSIVKKSSGGGR